MNGFAPIVKGRIDGAHVKVWCDYCNREHSHGRHESGECKYGIYKDDVPCTCPVGSGNGHRVAHCHNPESPYAETGYVIEEVEFLSKPRKDRRINRRNKAESHVLYRFYGADDRLLYIGITANPPQRFKAHRADKDWWSEVVVVRMETFRDRDALERAEKAAIKSEGPLYNVTHNRNSGIKPLESDRRAVAFTLAGKFFHTTRDCRCGARIAQWQGRILGCPTDGVVLVELFEWCMGEPSGQELVTLIDFMAKRPVLYDTAEDMRFSYDYGTLSHSGKNERCMDAEAAVVR